MLDDVLITKTTNTAVQTEVNAATKYRRICSLPAGTFYSKDISNRECYVRCNSKRFQLRMYLVEVNRSQTLELLQLIGSNTANNLKVMAKTFLVTQRLTALQGTLH